MLPNFTWTPGSLPPQGEQELIRHLRKSYAEATMAIHCTNICIYIYISVIYINNINIYIIYIYIWSSYRWMETIYININNHTYTSIIYPYIPWPSKCRWSPLSTINLAPENGKALPPIFLAKSSLANMTGSREVSYKSCFKQMQLNTFKCFFSGKINSQENCLLFFGGGCSCMLFLWSYSRTVSSTFKWYK